MSVVSAPLTAHTILDQIPQARKRTSSFSYPTAVATAFSPNPRPAKAARTTGMGAPLRRQETMLIAPRPHPVESVLEPNSSLLTTTPPYYRTLQYYKDQRLKRKAVLNRNGEPMTISTTPKDVKAPPAPQSFQPLPFSAAKATLPLKQRKSAAPIKRSAPAPKAPSKVILPSASSPITINATYRTSSPLAPNPTVRPGRPVFPRSKHEPDLYRTAIRTRMAGTVEGRKVLLMGARLAYSIEAATKELERIVADQQERDGDVVMSDSTPTSISTSQSIAPSTPHSASLAMPVLTASWVMVKGEDWEMVDCAA